MGLVDTFFRYADEKNATCFRIGSECVRNCGVSSALIFISATLLIFILILWISVMTYCPQFNQSMFLSIKTLLCWSKTGRIELWNKLLMPLNTVSATFCGTWLYHKEKTLAASNLYPKGSIYLSCLSTRFVKNYFLSREGLCITSSLSIKVSLIISSLLCTVLGRTEWDFR